MSIEEAGAVAPAVTKPARSRGWIFELSSFAELFALAGVGVAQPLLDSLQKNSTDVFVHRGASRADIVFLTIAIVFGPPFVLWVGEAICGLVLSKARRWAHFVTTGTLLFVLAWVILNRQFGASLWRPIGATLVAVVVAYGLMRLRMLRVYLRVLAIAPLVFMLLFLGSNRIAPLVFSSPPAALAVPVRHPSRVVMIVLDELPLESLLDGHGQINREMFPNFAALTGDSTWYRDTTTVTPFTALSVPAIVTGRYPQRADAIPIAASYPKSLFTLLPHTYEMNVREISEEQLCPATICHERATATFRSLLSASRNLWNGIFFTGPPAQFFNPDERNSAFPAADGFVRSLTASAQPRFDYVHVLLPHQPWNHVSTGQTYPDDDGNLPGNAGVWRSTAFAEEAHQRHLLQLQAVDSFIGSIVHKLKDLGVYNDSLVVLTADHGAAFTIGGDLRAPANHSNYPEILWVPLMIKQPGQTAGSISDAFAQTIDIVPTIAKVLGIQVPWKLDGQSLLTHPRPNGKRRFADLTLQQGFVPPSDPNYRDYDGIAGYKRVLAAKPFATGGDPSLRFYGIGDWAQLIAKPVANYPNRVLPGLSYLLDNPTDYLNVVPTAQSAPWSLITGGLSAPGRRFLMFAVNDKIAGFAHTTGNYFGGDAFWAMLVPQLFQAGANEVRIFDVGGTAAAPTFREIHGARNAPR